MHPVMGFQALRNVLVDRVTAQLHRDFDARGLPHLLLKGPALAQWLYREDEIRPYFDTDFLIPFERWDDAVALLGELGFADEQGEMAHPRMEGFASYAFVSQDAHLDLHCTFAGLGADYATVWEVLSSEAELMEVGGEQLGVLSKPARLMHVAVHAAHHHGGHPFRDLDVALERASDESWREAAAVARRVDALPFFATGLRLAPAGAALAQRLGVIDEVSPESELRAGGVPVAEGLHEWLETPGVRGKLGALKRELFPTPTFMRWWLPMAHSRWGLLAAYIYRPFWLLARLPRAVLTIRRARRRDVT